MPDRKDFRPGEFCWFDHNAHDLDAASAYGGLRTALERRGSPLGPYDMMIAAHALSLGLVLVTDNSREVKRVQRLRVENWRR